MKNRISCAVADAVPAGLIPVGALAEDAPISAEPVEDVSEEVEIARPVAPHG